MKPLLTLFFILSVATTFAQDEQVFTVQKSTIPPGKKLSGIYCSDFRGDGRECFSFDSTGRVQDFVGPRQLKGMSEHVGEYGRYSVDYLYVQDNISFSYTQVQTQIVNGKEVVTKVVTEYLGVVQGDSIDLTVVVTSNGKAQTYTLQLTRVKQ